MTLLTIAVLQIAFPFPILVDDDRTPPERVEDFRVTGGTASSLVFEWTTPIDTNENGEIVPINLFVIAYSTQPLPNIVFPEPGYVVTDDPNVTFITIDYIQDIGDDFAAGTPLSYALRGLPKGNTYHAAILAGDSSPYTRRWNWSPMSTEAVERPRLDWVNPGQIGDLALSGTAGDFTLSWTATGDDGDTGLAAAFDLRCSTRPIVSGYDFETAQPVSGAPLPGSPGSRQEAIVHVAPGATCYFAIRAMDEAGNVGPVSNTVRGEGVSSESDGGGGDSGRKTACGLSSPGVGASLVMGILLAALRGRNGKELA